MIPPRNTGMNLDKFRFRFLMERTMSLKDYPLNLNTKGLQGTSIVPQICQRIEAVW